MRTYIYPYKLASDGCVKLADGLGVLRLKGTSPVKLTEHDLVINWGNSIEPNWNGCKWLNHPSYVGVAVNKQFAFETFKKSNVSIPPFTTSYEEAKEWFSQNNAVVVQRQLLASNSGKGIKLAESVEELDKKDTKLYVKYIPKNAEYRVHVFQGDVIDIQQKRKKIGWQENKKYSSKICSHNNGWVFCRDDVNIPDKCIAEAISAVTALKLDFGAVDVIYNKLKNNAYVLEVNTAPGIEGETMFSYVNAFLNYREAM